MEFQSLHAAIEAADIITIYRHVHPDCDALGAQFGLRQWLRDQYPAKKIYALGADTLSQGKWPQSDQVSDETIAKSLAIVLDVGNAARVDDSRFATASAVFKIDHHPTRNDSFEAVQLVDTHAAATCEILASFFQKEQKGLSRTAAEYLYCGMLTDTLCFRTSNTTSETLAMASYISSAGIDIPGLNRMLFDQSMREFEFANYIRSHYQKLGDHVAYKIISMHEQETYRLKPSEARNFIDEFGHVTEFEVWAIFTEQLVNGKLFYDGSLRSKSIAVNDIAERFHGGGHVNAAGVKNLSSEELKSLLDSLFSRVSEKMQNAEIH
jgi:acetate kinase/phosphoesterase RecJ-like protein